MTEQAPLDLDPDFLPPGCACKPPSHSGHYSYCPLNAFGPLGEGPPTYEEAGRVIAEHMKTRGVSSAVVVDGSADDIIARFTAEGWELDEGTDYVSGKRIRYLRPPVDSS